MLLPKFCKLSYCFHSAVLRGKKYILNLNKNSPISESFLAFVVDPLGGAVNSSLLPIPTLQHNKVVFTFHSQGC